MNKWIIILFSGFYPTWILSLVTSIPYLYDLNTTFVLGLALMAFRDRVFTLVVPVFLLRVSQILHLEEKLVTLMIMALVFLVILGFLLVSKRELNKSYLALCVGAFAIEVWSYFY